MILGNLKNKPKKSLYPNAHYNFRQNFYSPVKTHFKYVKILCLGNWWIILFIKNHTSVLGFSKNFVALSHKSQAAYKLTVFFFQMFI